MLLRDSHYNLERMANHSWRTMSINSSSLLVAQIRREPAKATTTPLLAQTYAGTESANRTHCSTPTSLKYSWESSHALGTLVWLRAFDYHMS